MKYYWERQGDVYYLRRPEILGHDVAVYPGPHGTWMWRRWMQLVVDAARAGQGPYPTLEEAKAVALATIRLE